MPERVPPHDEAAEKAVLGAILIAWQDGFDRAVEAGISAESFYLPAHAALFRALAHCAASGRPIDQATVGERLRAVGDLERAGGALYLDHLIDATPTAAHLEYYARIVRARFLSRAVIEAARAAAEDAYEPGSDAEAVRSRAEFAMATLATASPAMSRRSNADVLGAQLTRWKQAQTIGSAGLPSGFDFWNKTFGGFMESGLYIVSGKPGCAKTTLVRNIVEHLVLTSGLSVAVSSLEMTAEQWLGAMAARLSTQDLFRLNSGHKGTDLAGLDAVAPDVSSAPLVIQDRPQTLPEFASWCRRMVGHEKARLVVLDYAQRLKPDQKYGSEEARYADYSVTIVNLAKELRVPFLVVARESDQGGLYGARQWEYDAWGWVRMTREDGRGPGYPPVFSVSIEKNRFGPLTGETLELITDGGFLRPTWEREREDNARSQADDGLGLEA